MCFRLYGNGKQSTLVFTSVKPSDFGRYTCTAFSRYGTPTVDVILAVMPRKFYLLKFELIIMKPERKFKIKGTSLNKYFYIIMDHGKAYIYTYWPCMSVTPFDGTCIINGDFNSS